MNGAIIPSNEGRGKKKKARDGLLQKTLEWGNNPLNEGRGKKRPLNGAIISSNEGRGKRKG